MGFLNTIFGSTPGDSGSNFEWNQLLTLDQLNTIATESHNQPIIIFKHSTRCSISRMALKQFEREFTSEDKVTPYFLDLIVNRDVSNEIAAKFMVTHQSPQIIVVKDGKSIYNASHSDISADKIKRLEL